MVAVSPSPTTEPSKSKRAKSEKQWLAINLIRTDGGTQSRAALDPAVIADYAEAMTDGATFPPVVVFYDGKDYWLADGFHRLQAVIKTTRRYKIWAIVRQGTQRDAVLYSVGVNADHGLRRNRDDKHRAVTTMVSDAEWSKWSDREIARQCRVSRSLVAEIRKNVTGFSASEKSFIDKHGNTSTMDVSGIQEANAQRATTPDATTAPVSAAPTPITLPVVEMVEVFDNNDDECVVHRMEKDGDRTPCGELYVYLFTEPDEGKPVRKCEKCYPPVTAITAPAAVQVAPLRFQPGMVARCQRCEILTHIHRATPWAFDKWTLEKKNGTIWRCPQGHRIFDKLIRIVPSAAPVEQPAPAPVSAPVPLTTEDGAILKYQPSDRAMCNQCNDWRHFIQVLPGGDLWQCKECSRQMRDDMMLLWSPVEAAARDEQNARWPRSTRSTLGPTKPAATDPVPAAEAPVNPTPVEPAKSGEPGAYKDGKTGKSVEWYTPRHIIDRAIAVMGGIDLDPCSNEGIPNVPATLRYTAATNGLKMPWRGRTFLNPPYDDVPSWVDCLIKAYDAHTVPQAIVVLANRTDQVWFQALAKRGLLCLVVGRLSFLKNGEEAGDAPFPSAIFYLGAEFNFSRFTKTFSDLGVVLHPMRLPQ